MKRPVGRPVTGVAKIKVAIRLQIELIQWIDAQPGDRTSVITAAIENYRQANDAKDG